MGGTAPTDAQSTKTPVAVLWSAMLRFRRKRSTGEAAIGLLWEYQVQATTQLRQSDA